MINLFHWTFVKSSIDYHIAAAAAADDDDNDDDDDRRGRI